MRNHFPNLPIYLCFTLLFVIIPVICSYSQTSGLNFKYLNSRSGLSIDDVRSIYQDKEGFMWFSTERGLDRYDGKEFRNYVNFISDSAYSMMQTVQQISGDSYKGLWYFSDTTGLCQLNTTTGKINRYIHISGNEKTISNNQVRSIFEDSRKNLWISTLGGGLNLFNRQDSTFRCFKHDSLNPESIGSNNITSITEDLNGMLWVSSPDGLLIRYDHNTGKFKNIHITDLPSFFWNSINSPVLCVDMGNKIWIGNQRDLYRYNQKQDIIEKIPLEISTGTQFTNISSLCELEADIILISTSNSGLYMYNSITGKTEHYVYNPADPYGINSNRLTQIYKSMDGVVWIGSSDNGINIYSRNSNRFPQLMNLLRTGDLEYANYSTFSLCELPDGNILIGTENNGVMKYKPDKKSIKRIIPELSNVSVFDMQLDKSGKVWLCCWINGFYSFDIHTGKIQQINNVPGTNIPIPLSIVRLCLDSRNRYWFGGIGTGLLMADPSTGISHTFVNIENDSLSLQDNFIFKIFEDSNGNIWVGTNTGLHLYDEINSAFRRIRLVDEKGNDLKNLMILDIVEDHNRQLWIGSSKTLHLLNRRTLISKSYAFKSKNKILSAIKILEDKNHILWLGTDEGICSFNPETGRFKDYGVSDVTYYLENNPNVGITSRSGYIYFGTAKGVIVFHPDNIRDDTVAPPVHITYLGVNDVEIKLDRIPKGNLLKLKFKQSTLEIRFAALNYNNTEANQYAHQLVGYDKTLIKQGNKNVAYYPNLPPGKYTFRVIASNSHGYWNNTGDQLLIQITSPVWKRLWFKVLVPLILIFLVISRIYQLRKKKVILERLVKERTKALNDANLDLKEHHEELRQQHEEITSQNEQLSQMSEEILKQNKELEQHRTNLEKLVEERTRELGLALKKAEESDRLKSAFLANMSHEIRTPMNAIVGFANLLKDNDLSQEEKVEFIDVINANSETLLVLIDDILDLSLIEANQLKIRKEIFSINEMLDHLHSSYSLMNRKADLIIRLNNELHDQDILVNSDRIRIKQVLSNLMNNACKFTEAGFVELGAQEADGRLSFYVKDTGIGIEKSNLSHIFERFRKSESGTNAFYRGTGLGLAISKALASLLDGDLSAESETGKGSTFRFTLPGSIITQDKKALISIPVQTNGHKWSGRDILIVEDEQANYLYAKKLLGKLEVNIHWAENGAEAVRLVDSGSMFHIILMDIKMPVMDGFEATKVIKGKYPDQIVIALTAYARPEDRVKFMQAGFDDYLAKPIRPNDFLAVIRRYI